MEEQNFEQTKALLKEKFGSHVSGKTFTCEYISSIEETSTYIKVLMHFTTASQTIPRELKFSIYTFDTIEKIEAEVLRILQRFDDFYDALVYLKTFVNTDTPNYTDQWQFQITEVINPADIPFADYTSDRLPIYEFAAVSVTFYRLHNGEPQTFVKDFTLSVDSFISFATYQEQIQQVLDQLNTPISITTDYYESMITQTTY